VAVCDETFSKAKAKARQYGAHHAFSDYESMLNLDLDLIDIVTPTPTHERLSCLALETGHNVLVEKPMALSSGECRAMIRSANKSGRTLCVGHNKLFFKTVTQAKAAVDDGTLQVSRLRISHHFAYNKLLEGWRLNAKSGGILWDAIVHPAYLTERFLGPITSVYATARKVEEQLFDSFTIVLQNKKVGVTEYVWNAKQPLFELQLITEDGKCLHLDLVHDFILAMSRHAMNRNTYPLRLVAKDLQVPLARWSSYFQSFWAIRSYPGALPFQRTFFVLIRQLLSFLNGDQDHPPVSPEEGLRSVRILESVKKSIASDRPQRIAN
jgi:predicted dehydrogenase